MTTCSSEDPTGAAAALRERLSRLSEASLRINESLDFETVLQGVLDSARALASARYGVLAVLDHAGQLETLLSSGLTCDEFRGLQEIPGGAEIFHYLGSLTEALRVADFAGHARSLGLPELALPVPAGPFLAAPVQHIGRRVGNVYLAKQERGGEFSAEDEETLVMFAAQAALAGEDALQQLRDQFDDVAAPHPEYHLALLGSEHNLHGLVVVAQQPVQLVHGAGWDDDSRLVLDGVG